jgi:internalin A
MAKVIRKVERLDDVEFMRDDNTTESLIVCINNITSLEPLRGNTTLKDLIVSSNRITDASVLSSVTNLTRVCLEANRIPDIEFMRDGKLQSLIELDISFTPVTDLSPLQGNTSLVKLDIRGMRGGIDLSYVQSIGSLKSLDVSCSNVTNLQLIGNLPLLEELELTNMKFDNDTDLSFINNIVSLRSLNLSRNSIDSIEFLRGNESITYLTIQFTKVSDLSPLTGNRTLKRLDIQYNTFIKNLDFMKANDTLEIIDAMGASSIECIDGLEGNVTIFELDLRFTKVRDHTHLLYIPSLVELSLTYGSNGDKKQKRISKRAIEMAELNGRNINNRRMTMHSLLLNKIQTLKMK